jgi:Tol biopolymer transport system component
VQLDGDATAVADGVGHSLVFGFHAASPAALAYRTSVSENIQLQWFDRQGKPASSVGEPITRQSSVSLSRDGQRALVFRLELRSVDIWLLDLRRELFLRLTTNPGINSNPVWSPDENRFAYASNTQGSIDMRQSSVNGDFKDEPLLTTRLDGYPESWSADGRFLLFTTRGTETSADLWVLPFNGSKAGTAFPFANTRAAESAGRYSPDGRWIAYTSDETGTTEAYVRSFTPSDRPPSVGSKVRVSTGGGSQLKWRSDGKELFYVGSDGRLMGVAVQTDDSFHADTPQPLFPMPPAKVWDVAADGKRFLVGVPVEQRAQVPFTVVLNWMAGLHH